MRSWKWAIVSWWPDIARAKRFWTKYFCNVRVYSVWQEDWWYSLNFQHKCQMLASFECSTLVQKKTMKLVSFNTAYWAISLQKSIFLTFPLFGSKVIGVGRPPFHRKLRGLIWQNKLTGPHWYGFENTNTGKESWTSLRPTETTARRDDIVSNFFNKIILKIVHESKRRSSKISLMTVRHTYFGPKANELLWQ